MVQMLAMAQEPAATAAPGTGGLCMTMLFPNDAKAKFDAARYASKHLPLLKDVYGDSIERIELRTSTGSTQGVPSELLATTTFWIRDVAGFSQKLSANFEKINKDLDQHAKGNRLNQIDRVVYVAGEDRAQAQQNSHVFSLFYRELTGGPGAAGAGEVKFDHAYFTAVFLPKLYSLYGSNAVRRLEATRGVDQGEQKARQLAAYHLYIRDRNDYDNRSASVFNEMQKDAGKFMQGIFPMFADMRLAAIA